VNPAVEDKRAMSREDWKAIEVSNYSRDIISDFHAKSFSLLPRTARFPAAIAT
jgi:hypothetical protein